MKNPGYGPVYSVWVDYPEKNAVLCSKRSCLYDALSDLIGEKGRDVILFKYGGNGVHCQTVSPERHSWCC